MTSPIATTTRETALISLKMTTCESACAHADRMKCTGDNTLEVADELHKFMQGLGIPTFLATKSLSVGSRVSWECEEIANKCELAVALVSKNYAEPTAAAMSTYQEACLLWGRIRKKENVKVIWVRLDEETRTPWAKTNIGIDYEHVLYVDARGWRSNPQSIPDSLKVALTKWRNAWPGPTPEPGHRPDDPFVPLLPSGSEDSEDPQDPVWKTKRRAIIVFVVLFLVGFAVLWWLGRAADTRPSAVAPAQSVTPLITLKEAKEAVRAVAFTDGFLATGSKDNKVRVYSTTDWILRYYKNEATNWINALAFGNGFLAAGSDDNAVRIYSTRGWYMLSTLHEARDWILAVAFSPRGFLATGGKESIIRVYGTSDWALRQKLTQPGGWINSLVFGRDFLAAGCGDGRMLIYSLSNWMLQRVLSPAQGYIAAVALGPGLLAAGGKDFTVWVYSTVDWTLRHNLTEARAEVKTVAFGAGLLAVGGHDREVQIYNTSSWTLQSRLNRSEDWIYAVAFGNGLLAAGDGDTKVRVYQT